MRTVWPAKPTTACMLLLALVACGQSPPPAAPVLPAVVEKPRPFQPSIQETYAGDVRARHETSLGFRVGGQVERRAVNVGDRVRQGQLLASLEREDFTLQTQAARAALETARADLALARSERDRHAVLLRQNHISKTLYEARDNAWKAARARFAQAEAQLALVRNQAAYGELKAPADGVVTAIHVEPGQVVAAGYGAVDWAPTDQREVRVTVSEDRIARFRLGQSVQVEINGLPNPVQGQVHEIAPSADPATRTYAVRVLLPNALSALPLGLSARVYLQDAAHGGNSWILPLEALHERSGQPAVWVFDPHKQQVHLVPVRLKAYREDGAWIESGIDENTWVVAAGVHKLHEGQTVRPIDRRYRPIRTE